MKKLQFTAQYPEQSSVASVQTQSKVTALLVERLGSYGFQTLPQSGDQIAVSVDEHTLPLSISCAGQDDEGRLVCEITSYPDEQQDWVARIAEQSLLNQLALAVENTLKEKHEFADFQWKEE